MHPTDGPKATIYVPSAGLHTLNVWMREDGFKADKIVLLPGDVNTNVVDFGPAESPRVAGSGGSGGSTAVPDVKRPERFFVTGPPQAPVLPESVSINPDKAVPIKPTQDIDSQTKLLPSKAS